MTLDASGRLGIGTTSPTQKLDVNGSINASGELISQSNDARISLYRSTGTNYFDWSSGQALYFSTQTAAGGTGRDTKLVITSGGNVGIGTTSPNRTLTVNGLLGVTNGTANTQQLVFSIDGSAAYLTSSYIGTSSYVPMVFEVGGSERMRITSGGELYQNTTSQRSTGWSTNPAGQLVSEMTNYGGAQWFTNVANDEGSYLVLGKSRGTSVNSNTIVQSGDILGALIFQGTDGSAAQGAARIVGKVDGTPGANDMPGRLEFHTTADGSAIMTERMRITSGGNVGIGVTNPAGKFQIGSVGSTGYGVPNGLTFGDGTRAGALEINTNGVVLYSSTSNIIFSPNTTEAMRIASGGELLINTTSDAGDYKLQVNGNGYFNGNMQSTDYRFPQTGYITWNINNLANESLIFRDYGTTALTLTTSNAQFAGSIKTAAPSGGTAKPFKIGAAAVVSPTSPNRTIEIEIDGVTYYLSAKTTND
jgi:hypothetical protein